MDIIQQYGALLIIITAVFGFFMAFGVGANDVSNAMGTSVGSGTITAKQAIIIALIFECAGAYLAGGEVAQTIQSGMISPTEYTAMPEVLALGMMSSLLSAGLWLVIASHFGWPVSTTHTIVGAIVGFGYITVGAEAVEWGKIGNIVSSWFVTPFIAGVIAYLIFFSTQKLIFNREQPARSAQRIGPWYMGLTIWILAIVTMTKGLTHIGLNLSPTRIYMLATLLALISIGVSYFYFRSERFQQGRSTFGATERVFSILMLLTACAMAFAHGSNDVANAIGPLAAVVSIIDHQGVLVGDAPMAWWILPLGATGMAVGLMVMGRKVMATIGSGITDLTPSRGFAAQFATAVTVVLASGTGLPISTTQTLVGAILGIGFARGIAALNIHVIRNIVLSWLITLPAGAFFVVIIYEILRYFFH